MIIIMIKIVVISSIVTIAVFCGYKLFEINKIATAKEEEQKRRLEIEKATLCIEQCKAHQGELKANKEMYNDKIEKLKIYYQHIDSVRDKYPTQ